MGLLVSLLGRTGVTILRKLKNTAALIDALESKHVREAIDALSDLKDPQAAGPLAKVAVCDIAVHKVWLGFSSSGSIHYGTGLTEAATRALLNLTDRLGAYPVLAAAMRSQDHAVVGKAKEVLTEFIRAYGKNPVDELWLVSVLAGYLDESIHDITGCAAEARWALWRLGELNYSAAVPILKKTHDTYASSSKGSSLLELHELAKALLQKVNALEPPKPESEWRPPWLVDPRELGPLGGR